MTRDRTAPSGATARTWSGPIERTMISPISPGPRPEARECGPASPAGPPLRATRLIVPSRRSATMTFPSGVAARAVGTSNAPAVKGAGGRPRANGRRPPWRSRPRTSPVAADGHGSDRIARGFDVSASPERRPRRSLGIALIDRMLPGIGDEQVPLRVEGQGRRSPRSCRSVRGHQCHGQGHPPPPSSRSRPRGSVMDAIPPAGRARRTDSSV